MKFYQVFLRNVRECYTWHSSEPIPVGTRVSVKFRNKKRIGIVISPVLETPTFKTQPILESFSEWGILASYIQFAQKLAPSYFTSVGKFLSLMIPEEFLEQKDPVQKDVWYEKNCTNEIKPRGNKQKLVLELFTESKELSEPTVLEKASKSVLQNMVAKGFLKQSIDGVSVPSLETYFGENFSLNSAQQRVFDDIQSSSKPTVLWGVTGSGKTEIYKKLAEQTAGQTLFLLPEIALTPQLIGQFQALFGAQVAVWHSKLSRREKIQTWARLQTGEVKVLIGTRSSVLIPLPNLSLIILDEEHEWTFKNEFAPRYWTHDLAEHLAQQQKAQLVFGSATPRTESLEKCQAGVWHLTKLFQTVHKTTEPKFRLVDLKQEQKKGNYSPLSESLAASIRSAITRGEQVVLFLNKRGYAGASMCKSCGAYFECPDCSQNMKFHTNGHCSKLICHICGYLQSFPSNCPHCQAKDFLFRGWGTQQVEQAVLEQIPEAKVLRADADSVRGKHDFKHIWQAFKNKQANVLIGTQMIAKGLDFESVTLVGLILADVGLSLPDFRAQERVFQLLNQVSGRAGRRKQAGTIVLQTFHPDESVFQFLIKNEYENFYQQELEHRKKFALPPFTAFAKITISDQKKAVGLERAKHCQTLLQSELETKSPDGIFNIHMAPAFFPRSHNQYHFHIFVQGQNEAVLRDFLQTQAALSSLKVDINPSSLL
ncbi:primosomal protein N' [bacterium DOLZORAL124_38_8]|nr:MAG: primosomal protein N' [bacterium DOLZORAL124_38_8]